VPEVLIVDYGGGNVRSVQRALERAGAQAALCADPDRLATAERLVFPGQGALPDVMAALSGGLGEALRAQLATGRPFLGICVGLQALFERGEEHGGSPGLGLLPGTVRRFPPGGLDPAGRPLKVPHMGWNEVRLSEAGLAHPVLGQVGQGRHFYFVHSYYVEPADPSLVVAETEHGQAFTSAVARDNLLACQFHPEKSQGAGEALLSAWLERA